MDITTYYNVSIQLSREMKKVHQRSSVFRGNMPSCDAIICLYVLNLQVDILDEEDEQHFGPGQLWKFKSEKWSYLNCFGCLILEPSAYEGSER